MLLFYFKVWPSFIWIPGVFFNFYISSTYIWTEINGKSNSRLENSHVEQVWSDYIALQREFPVVGRIFLFSFYFVVYLRQHLWGRSIVGSDFIKAGNLTIWSLVSMFTYIRSLYKSFVWFRCSHVILLKDL